MAKIQPGDVLFYKPNSFIGRMIAKITKSPYSHVALAIDENTVLESDLFIKTRLTTIGTTDTVYHVYRLKDITAYKRQLIIENALHTLTTRYDYLQIFGLFLRYVFRLNYLTFNSYNRFICSEVIDYSFLMAGVSRKDYEHVRDVSPRELLEKYELYRVR